MAGTTLTALQGQNGVRVVTTVAIEGIPWVLTSGDPQAAFSAHDTANGTTTSAYSGLTVHWDQQQRVKPFEPFTDPCLVKFSVVPAVGYVDGTGAVTISDVVGTAVFKRTGGTETGIATALDCDGLSLVTQRADDFAASGTLYVGPESMAYSSRDTGTDTFTLSARGQWSPFYTSTSAPFSRTHKPLTPNEQDIGIPPVVSSEPRTWVGRWVAVWLHRDVGGTLDVPLADQTAAHLAFAGQIVSVSDADGATWFEAVDLRRSLYSTRLNRDQFRARVQDGVWIPAGAWVDSATYRQVSGGGATLGSADALTVVTSGASGTNQMNEGYYTPHELAAKIQAWLQGERVATRILFNCTYAINETANGFRAVFSFVDPTSTSGLIREATVVFSHQFILRAQGWENEVKASSATRNGSTTSPRPPTRIYFDQSQGAATITLAEPRGTWISQEAELPVSLQDAVEAFDGIINAGDLGFLRAKRISDTSFRVSAVGMANFFPPGRWNVTGNWGVEVNLDDEGSFDVRQVLVIDSPFKTLLLKILFSTGTSAFNHATYDTFSEALGCGVPASLMPADFITEVGQLSCADTTAMTVIDGATTFHDLFKADFILRRCFFVWANGRLCIRTWSTPTSEYATTTLDETTKATPVDVSDVNRSAVTESADYYNIVRVRYNIDAAGEYADELILKDPVSIRLYGERSIEIKARNSFRRIGALGPLDELISTFAGFFGYTSRPWQVITRTIDFSKFEAASPGAVLTLTDRYIRDPSTGLRYSNVTSTGGLSGFPGLVVESSIDWGGAGGGRGGGEPVTTPATGEVKIMISPARTIAAYVPCAQVDDTAAGGGYNAGTKVLTCYAHEHSEASEVADATRFVAGDEVLVVQMDPQTAASAQSWSDVVASQTGNTITLTTGLAGFDVTLRYRVIYDTYATVGTSQRSKCFQADDTDGLIADLAQAYAFGFFGSSQSNSVTLSVATSLPARHSTLAYGDGRPLDVGYERDAVRLANNLINYKTAFQSPTVNTELRNFTGAGTYQLVECTPIFVGMGGLTAGYYRLLSLAPRMRSTDGNTASVRVTFSPRRPSGTTRDDVTRLWPYVSLTFTTTTTANFVVTTASTLNIARGNLADQLLGGVNYLYVEINNKAEYTGLARARLGPLTL